MDRGGPTWPTAGRAHRVANIVVFTPAAALPLQGPPLDRILLRARPSKAMQGSAGGLLVLALCLLPLAAQGLRLPSFGGQPCPDLRVGSVRRDPDGGWAFSPATAGTAAAALLGVEAECDVPWVALLDRRPSAFEQHQLVLHLLIGPTALSEPTCMVARMQSCNTHAPLSLAGGIAWGSYLDGLHARSNFGQLRVTTSGEHPDADQLYAAGFLEGYLTANRIWDNWVGAAPDRCCTPGTVGRVSNGCWHSAARRRLAGGSQLQAAPCASAPLLQIVCSSASAPPHTCSSNALLGAAAPGLQVNMYDYFTKGMGAEVQEPMRWVQEQDRWVRGRCSAGAEQPGREAGEERFWQARRAGLWRSHGGAGAHTKAAVRAWHVWGTCCRRAKAGGAACCPWEPRMPASVSVCSCRAYLCPPLSALLCSRSACCCSSLTA